MYKNSTRKAFIALIALFVVFSSMFIQAKEVSSASRIYVKWDAVGSNDGTSWTHAYVDLQDALAVAVSGDEIWVAMGTYKPTSGSDRTAAFRLKSDVGIYGGFAGWETSRDQRDWETNIVTLSGDLLGNDNSIIDINEPTRSENNYNVVFSDGVDATAILDGFTITGGNANYEYIVQHVNDNGAGIHNNNSSIATYRNLIIENNSARNGGGVSNNGSSPTFKNVTFRNNTANAAAGGGMSNLDSSNPIISESVFDGNSAASSGGGIYNNQSSPIISDTAIHNNTAIRGGGIWSAQCNSTFINISLRGNSASWGGGVYNMVEASPIIVNSLLAGNYAENDGGAIYNNTLSHPTLRNVTISNNMSSTGNGGGIYNASSNNPVVYNSILWGNYAGENISEWSQIYNDTGSSTTVSYSVIHFGASYSGNGNITSNPLFAYPVDADNAPTVEGDYHLVLKSPAIDAGNNNDIYADTLDLDGDNNFSEAIPYDLDGQMRQWDSIADDTGEGTAPIVDMGAYEGSVVYVDYSATGLANGKAWTDAFTDLQDALASSHAGDEIWVAIGTYMPTTGTDREATFHLIDGAALLGGFVGDETSRDQRNWDNNPTILSGDLLQNDNDNIDDDEPTRSDNIYHVVSCSPTLTKIIIDALTSTFIDGFYIQGGNANGDLSNEDKGGGLLCEGTFLQVNQIIIKNNSSRGFGGGAYMGGSPTITNSVFSGNKASTSGGGLYQYEGSLTISKVQFLENHSDWAGGGLYNHGSNINIVNGVFSGNIAVKEGGGFLTNRSDASLTNSLVSGNTAGENGGGIYNFGYGGNTLLVENSTISSNLSSGIGGGYYDNNDGNDIFINNSIIWNNKDSVGTGDISQIIDNSGSLTINYSVIPGTWSGSNNLDVNPLFVNPIIPDNAPFSNGNYRLQITSLAIDAGDNAAVPVDVTDLDDNSNTAERIPFDLDGKSRFYDHPEVDDTGNPASPYFDIVDIGAYEQQGSPLVITEIHPENNSINAFPDTAIYATFDQEIDPPSVSQQSFAVHAMQTGQLLETYSVDNNTVTLTPLENLKPGELVQVSATTDIESLNGLGADTPSVWQFRVEATSGTGIFEDSERYLGLWKTWEVALGDIDKDGDLDAVTANWGNQSNRVYLNNGGTLTEMAESIGGSASTEDVALGDLNGDGYLDVFFAYISSTGKNQVWLNNGEWDSGTGGFEEYQRLDPAWSNQAIDLGDLDGDGDLDVFIANSDSDFGSTVLFNDGTGFFSADDEDYSTGGDVKLGDLDGDDDLDAVIVGSPNVIWFNAGGLQGGTPGKFISGQVFWNNVRGGFASLGDVDNDGDLDILLGNMDQNPNEIWFNQGGRQGGTLGAFVDSGQRMGASTSEGAYFGDLDGDGDLDAFFTNDNGEVAGGEPNEIWINTDGFGEEFSQASLLGNSDSLAAALGDINGDGSLDIFVANGYTDGGDANEIWLNGDNDFVITVQTDNPGTSSDTQFTIPTYSEETYNYNVDCDDDGIDEATSVNGDYTCIYATVGTYTISITDNTGTNTGFPRIYFNNTGDKDKLLSIEQWGENKWKSMASAFYGCSNLAGQAIDNPDLSNVTDMNSMFFNAAVFNQNIGTWDTDNVIDMNSMFRGTSAFNQNISGWNTSNVTDMSQMFQNAISFEQNLGSWNVGELRFANSMFDGVKLSTTNYDALLIGWNGQALQSNVAFSGGNSTYCNGETDRNELIDTHGWTITDGGNDCELICSLVPTIPLEQNHSDQLNDAADINAYKFNVSKPYTTIIATLTPPATGDFDLSLFDSCDSQVEFPWDIGRRAVHIGRRAVHIGEEDENIYVRFNVGEEVGVYYLAVQMPEDGTYSGSSYQLHVELDEPIWELKNTLILYNPSRFKEKYDLDVDAASQMMHDLTLLAERPQVNGVILQLDQFQNVKDAYTAWDAPESQVTQGDENSYSANVEAANEVVRQIRIAMLDLFLEKNIYVTEYVVIIGDDHQIPFERRVIGPDPFLGDPNWMSEDKYLRDDDLTDNEDYSIGDTPDSPLDAALMLDRTLTDDYYSDYWEFNHKRNMPRYAVGRLQDTQERIQKAIYQFIDNNGLIDLTMTEPHAAVAGDGFLTDAADKLCARLTDIGWVSRNCDLVDPLDGFSGDDLYQAFIISEPDFAAHYYHTNHAQLLGPNDPPLISEQINTATNDLSNSLWWVIGCHSGLVLPESENLPLSLPQALADQGITYLGNTGWAWGVDGPPAYSELLYNLVAEQLTAESNISIGKALNEAKQTYYIHPNTSTDEEDYSYYDEKVVAQATLYGLPMMVFDFPSTISEGSSLPENMTRQEIPCASCPTNFHPWPLPSPGNLIQIEKTYNGYSYYESSEGGYKVYPNAPIAPQSESINFETTTGRGIGVIWIGGAYQVEVVNNPLVVMPRLTNDLAESGNLTFSGIYPLLPVTLTGVEDWNGDYMNHLVFQTGQYFENQGTVSIRKFPQMDFLIGLWEGESADISPPSLGTLNASNTGSSLHFELPVEDTSGVYKAYLTYTINNQQASTGEWLSVELLSGVGECVPGENVYTLDLPVSGQIEYFIQVMDCHGNVSRLYNGANYFHAVTDTPFVTSVTRADTNPTSAANVDFTVTFSEAVTGVDTTDFALIIAREANMSPGYIINVNGSGDTYTVTVDTGEGSSLIRLDLVDNDTIIDTAGNMLGGTGFENGDYLAGETYKVEKTTNPPNGIPLILGAGTGLDVNTEKDDDSIADEASAPLREADTGDDNYTGEEEYTPNKSLSPANLSNNEYLVAILSSSGEWRESYQNATWDLVIWDGISGNIPVPRDYNSVGQIDIAIYRSGVWWLRTPDGAWNKISWRGMRGITP